MREGGSASGAGRGGRRRGGAAQRGGEGAARRRGGEIPSRRQLIPVRWELRRFLSAAPGRCRKAWLRSAWQPHGGWLRDCWITRHGTVRRPRSGNPACSAAGTVNATPWLLWWSAMRRPSRLLVAESAAPSACRWAGKADGC